MNTPYVRACIHQYTCTYSNEWAHRHLGYERRVETLDKTPAATDMVVIDQVRDLKRIIQQEDPRFEYFVKTERGVQVTPLTEQLSREEKEEMQSSLVKLDEEEVSWEMREVEQVLFNGVRFRKYNANAGVYTPDYAHGLTVTSDGSNEYLTRILSIYELRGYNHVRARTLHVAKVQYESTVDKTPFTPVPGFERARFDDNDTTSFGLICIDELLPCNCVLLSSSKSRVVTYTRVEASEFVPI